MDIALAAAISVVMIGLALRKGFNPLFWVVAGGLPGVVALLTLPSAKAAEIDGSTRITRQKRANMIGAGLSIFALSVLVLLLYAG